MFSLRAQRPLLLTAFVAFDLSVLGAWLTGWLPGRVALVGDWLALTPTLNPGIAFGLTFAPALQFVLILVAASLVLWAAVHTRTWLEQIAFGLILGGAVGNLLDRALDGYVTDVFQVGTFPIFNVADACISVGAAILILLHLRGTGGARTHE